MCVYVLNANIFSLFLLLLWSYFVPVTLWSLRAVGNWGAVFVTLNGHREKVGSLALVLLGFILGKKKEWSSDIIPEGSTFPTKVDSYRSLGFWKNNN